MYVYQAQPEKGDRYSIFNLARSMYNPLGRWCNPPYLPSRKLTHPNVDSKEEPVRWERKPESGNAHKQVCYYSNFSARWTGRFENWMQIECLREFRKVSTYYTDNCRYINSMSITSCLEKKKYFNIFFNIILKIFLFLKSPILWMSIFLILPNFQY